MRSRSSALGTSELEPAAYPLPQNPDLLLAAQIPPAVVLLVPGNGVISAEADGNAAGNVERLNHPYLPRVEHKPDLLCGGLDVRFRHSEIPCTAARSGRTLGTSVWKRVVFAFFRRAIAAPKLPMAHLFANRVVPSRSHLPIRMILGPKSVFLTINIHPFGRELPVGMVGKKQPMFNPPSTVRR